MGTVRSGIVGLGYADMFGDPDGSLEGFITTNNKLSSSFQQTQASWYSDLKLNANIDLLSTNYNPMAGHANADEIRPFNIKFLPLIAY